MLAVPAVHPSLLALAVVAGAVGPLDDARGAVGAVLVPCLRPRRPVQGHQQQQEEGGGRGGRDQPAGRGGHCKVWRGGGVGGRGGKSLQRLSWVQSI